MPKSKRAKIVHLTKTKKKGREKGDAFIEEVRDCVDEFSNIFLFEVENMRNAAFKALRTKWTDSRFMIGRNKLIMIALGTNKEDEYRDGISDLAKNITGDRGLLFTNKDMKSVTSFFKEFKEPQYARAGCIAARKFDVPAGELKGLPVSMEPQLRKLGLPIRIQKGKLVVAIETTICEAGNALTVEQCKILEMFETKMVSFRINILGCYADEKFARISSD
eukprot:CAMPEP_0184499850 /NCGR_PEP_ID=MMETSP0113_2-20130426/42772_1 /TAXON_ID=91329 /ORGANISM="Norrisiella sphaerica, Strain BC52" /LENGTH=219 /DNA_ID=CAMNT_0026887937 /DNA_START=39 /DNA_END=698 /DNA_ORIENTATION=+